MSSDVAEKIHRHFSQYPRREYPKGHILMFADENPDHIFYIVKGRVRKYDISYRGEEVIINTFQPPSFFPMSWAVNRTPNKFFYKTETVTVMHTIPAQDALDFMRQNPDVMLDLLSRLYIGLEGIYGRLVRLMSGSARSRLIYELLIECRRFGTKQANGSYILRSSEVDLAARSGLSRETVSREIQKLKADHKVSKAKHVITVHDIKLLEESLGKGV